MNVRKVTILCGPVYINSPVRAGLQRRGRLICCPGESGDIHPSLFYQHILFLLKNKFIFALVCNIVYAGQLFMTKSDIVRRRWRHANIFWHRWSSLLNGLPHRLTTPWPSLRPRRLTTRRTTCPSAPAYNAMAGSSVCAASDVAVVFTVRLSRPGLHQHTGPHLSA